MNYEQYGRSTASAQYFLQLAGYLGIPVIAWNADNSGLERVSHETGPYRRRGIFTYHCSLDTPRTVSSSLFSSFHLIPKKVYARRLAMAYARYRNAMTMAAAVYFPSCCLLPVHPAERNATSRELEIPVKSRTRVSTRGTREREIPLVCSGRRRAACSCSWRRRWSIRPRRC